MKTRKYFVDWAAAYAAFTESRIKTVTEFYCSRIAEFVIKGKKPTLCNTQYHFNKLRKQSSSAKESPAPSVRRVHPIRKFGPRLQFATLDDDILYAGCQPTADSSQNTVAVPFTMHVRLANGTELAFATADPEKFASDLIIKAAGLI